MTVAAIGLGVALALWVHPLPRVSELLPVGGRWVAVDVPGSELVAPGGRLLAAAYRYLERPGGVLAGRPDSDQVMRLLKLLRLTHPWRFAAWEGPEGGRLFVATAGRWLPLLSRFSNPEIGALNLGGRSASWFLRGGTLVIGDDPFVEQARSALDRVPRDPVRRRDGLRIEVHGSSAMSLAREGLFPADISHLEGHLRPARDGHWRFRYRFRTLASEVSPAGIPEWRKALEQENVSVHLAVPCRVGPTGEYTGCWIVNGIPEALDGVAQAFDFWRER